MPPIATSHRQAVFVIGLWLVLFIGYRLTRADNRSEPAAPPNDPTQAIAGTHPSATVGAWQIFPLIPKESADGRDGTIRVGRNADGLVICGVVDGSEPSFPKTSETIRGHDHIEVALTDGAQAELPPIGWGNQFGFVYPQSATDTIDMGNSDRPDVRAKEMAARRIWYETQLPYRKKVTQLFERRWRIAPDRIEEFCATEAFAKLTMAEQKDLSLLTVRGVPVASFAKKNQTTYEFEILVPWEAFPPMRSLSLRDIRLMVTVVSNTHNTSLGVEEQRSSIAYWTTQSDSAPAPIPVRLATSREYTLTPCHFALADALVPSSGGEPFSPSDEAVRYIRPGRGSDLDLVVVMDNTALGYQYEPEPTSRSPIAKEARFWSRPLADDGLLGGPPLTWCHQGIAAKSNFVVRDPTILELRTGSDGDVLIKHGPLETNSYFGSGQCGGCPAISLDLYQLRKTDHTILNPLSLGTVVNIDADLTLSSDWRVASLCQLLFDHPTDSTRWQRIDHVRSPDGTNYREQPVQIITAPPEPRTLTFGDGK